MTLPEGSVTMLFTDIEGSTSLLRRLGSDYATVLSVQRRIMRDAIAAHGGTEMGTEGDSFFVVFSAPVYGIGTVTDAQRALVAADWPQDADVRVRMGLHVGELTRHDEGYVGMELNRAARIASTANGQQVIVSDPMRAAVEDVVGRDQFRDLGFHRLKDIPDPEHLYRMVIDGVPEIDTPPKTLGTPTNLPPPRSELVGRDRDAAEVSAFILGGTRLVTLTGPGGVGKTSLATHVARGLGSSFPGGVYLVPLEDAHDEAAAWPVIASSIGAPEVGEPAQAVGAALGDRPALLVLDNLEQLHGSSALANELTDSTQASILATSRGPLHVRAEQQFPVRPLAIRLPDDAPASEVAHDPAVELFVREARRVKPSFAPDDDDLRTIARVCSSVDGLPLAIELVAARMRHLSLDGVASSLDGRLSLSSRDVDRPDRQRTLDAAVAWSFDLLDADHQSAFRRLGAFVGGFALPAAAAVLARSEADTLDLLDELGDVGLLTFDDAASEVRGSMLRLVREFASAGLDAAEPDGDARRSHAHYFADLAEAAMAGLRGPAQLAWSDRLATEHENMRAAFEWSLTSPTDRALASRIAAALSTFWYRHGRVEGRSWLERAIGVTDDPALEMQVALALGILQQHQGDNAIAAATFERALELARTSGDDAATTRALNSLGVTQLAEGNLDSAARYLAESADLARRTGDDNRLASSLSNLGLVQLALGDTAAAIASFTDALRLDESSGDTWAIVSSRSNLGIALIRSGAVDQGRKLVVDVLPTIAELADPDLLAGALEACAFASGAANDPRTAAVLAGGALRIRDDASIPRTASDEAFLEREFGPARASLGRATWDELVAAGRASSDDDLIALASSAAVGGV